ncbi:DUF523 domain-containing protein [Nitrincola tapanii]|uniref:DUF523 domain-containing protein n=1 Tax=Nitrincola tapanii TaxID=1708751 RepID=A0A5A9W590_9GAMM|nr:DUF523 domain-containing protein [Nitrincola tapanii]KAA0875248.1 DUF523 domain-containing protein [Nitrincola tapanii]
MQKILVSACLMGSKVRYDGRDNALHHPTLERWQQEGRLVPVCPEVLGGLGVPRAPAETLSRFPILIATQSGEDVTPEFLKGAETTLAIAQTHQVCCALMKARSPSCGNREIYNGQFNGTLMPAPGVAADELIRHGIPVFNEEQMDTLIAFVEAQIEASESKTLPSSGSRTRQAA